MMNILKSAFWGSMMGILMVQVVACQGGSKKSVTGTNIAARAEADKKSNAAHASAASAPGESLKAPADVLARTLQVLDQSHQVFQESWRLVVQDKTVKKTSVFQETEKMLQALASTQCDPTKSGKSAAAQPRQNTPRARAIRGRNGTTTSTAADTSDASDDTTTASPASSTSQNEKNVCWGHVNQGASDNQPTNINLYTAYTGDSKNTTGIAYIAFTSDTDVTMQFVVKALPDGVGTGLQSVQVLHTNDKTFDVITCNATIDASKNPVSLQKLSCGSPGLGQSKDTATHYIFETFTYDATASGSDPVLNLQAFTYADPKDISLPLKAPAKSCTVTATVPQGASSTIDVKEVCEDKEVAVPQTVLPPPPVIKPQQPVPVVNQLDSTNDGEPKGDPAKAGTPPNGSENPAAGAGDTGENPDGAPAAGADTGTESGAAPAPAVVPPRSAHAALQATAQPGSQDTSAAPAAAPAEGAAPDSQSAAQPDSNNNEGTGDASAPRQNPQAAPANGAAPAPAAEAPPAAGQDASE